MAGRRGRQSSALDPPFVIRAEITGLVRIEHPHSSRRFSRSANEDGLPGNSACADLRHHFGGDFYECEAFYAGRIGRSAVRPRALSSSYRETARYYHRYLATT
jgi:hypothetical protein